MNHPGGDPGIDRLGHVRVAGCIEPRGTTQRMGKMAAEVQQPLTLSLESRLWYTGFGGHQPPAVNRVSPLFTRSP